MCVTGVGQKSACGVNLCRFVTELPRSPFLDNFGIANVELFSSVNTTPLRRTYPRRVALSETSSKATSGQPNVSKQELDLLQFAAVEIAQPRAGAAPMPNPRIYIFWTIPNQ
jgi:hypothetical protein